MGFSLTNQNISGSGTATKWHSRSTSEPSEMHTALGFRENVGGMPSKISASDDSLQYIDIISLLIELCYNNRF